MTSPSRGFAPLEASRYSAPPLPEEPTRHPHPNKPFGDWGSVFGDDPVMASAALDRLLHRSTILNIKGESYRLREKRQAGLMSART